MKNINLGRIILFESTRPYNPNTGGSYRSMRVVVESLNNAGYKIFIVSYVKNSLLKFPNLGNVENIVIKHFSLRALINKIKKGSNKSINSSKKNLSKTSKIQSMVSKIIANVFLPFNILNLILVIKKIRPEFLYCNTGIPNDKQAIIASIISNVSVFCHLRNLPNISIFDRYLSRKLSGTISISSTVSSHYLTCGCILKNNMIIHNALGRDFENTEFELGDQILNKGEDFKISCFSRLIEWKGIETLIIAFKLFRDLGGNGTLSIFGNGPIKDYLETRAEELKISKYITFHGYVSNVIEEMKKSSIIVAPSDLDEPLGRVAMESKRLGIPVIASDKGGFLEIINHRVNGLLFEQKSYDALSKTIYDIYNNLSLRLSLAEEGLKQSKEWSSNNYSKNLLKFIEENK